MCMIVNILKIENCDYTANGNCKTIVDKSGNKHSIDGTSN